jgi:pilus assembly protein Flp/PilA
MIRTRPAPKRGERGAGLVEYALLVALIAVVCITAVTFLGTSGSAKFDKAGKAVDGTTEPSCSQYGAGAGIYHRITTSSGVQGDPQPGPCP